MGLIYFIIGCSCYLVFFATFLYLIAFIGNLQLYIPAIAPLIFKSIDIGATQYSTTTAILINLGLIGLFGLQHSIMARIPFKVRLGKIIGNPIERSFFVLVSSLTLLLIMYCWQPIQTIVWQVDHPAIQKLLWVLSFTGWGLVLISTFIINHFDLFGLRQVYFALRNKPYEPLTFRVKSLYKLTRHPLYLGFILAFWTAPTMTLGHLLLSAGLSLYIFIGASFEERDLISHFGDDYVNYKKKTAMLVPFLKFSKRS